jgi:capsular polysaccharide biosynthesis protein
MEKQIQLFGLIKGRIGIIMLSGVLLGAISFLFLVVAQKNFKVTTDFLIIQNQTGSQDFYTAAKSTEYIGKILTEAVYSDVFIDEVTNSGLVNKEFLPFDKKDRMKEWSNRVQVGGNLPMGMITVTTLDNDRAQALETSKAIADVLNKKNNLFRGNDQNIEVRIISGPTIEKNPELTNLILVIVGGFLMGAFITIVWIYYFPNVFVQKKNSYLVTSDEYEESLRYLDR